MRPALDRFSRLLHFVFECCLARPRVTAAVTCAAAVFAGWQLTRLKSELQVYNILDPSFPSTSSLREMRRIFDDGHSIILVFRPKRTGEKLTKGAVVSLRPARVAPV